MAWNAPPVRCGTFPLRKSPDSRFLRFSRTGGTEHATGKPSEPRRRNPTVLRVVAFIHVSVKWLSNGSSCGWGRGDLLFSLAGRRQPCHSQSPGMPHTFCLFYMSKQIVNWLIIFVLTMSFTAVSLLSPLFALFKYEPSGPPFCCTLLH